MLRSLAVTTAVVLTGCGSSSSGAASAPPGLSGTVLGQPFTPADSSALALSQATCSFSGAPASATGLLIGFGSFQGLCAFVTQHQTCGAKANATILGLLVVRANVTGGSPGPVQAGTYTIVSTSATPTPDAQGNITIAQAVVTKTDSACATPSTTPVATTGTITITSVGANITGSADVTFSDGSHVAGSFNAPACAFRTDVCTVLSGGSCPTNTCVP